MRATRASTPPPTKRGAVITSPPAELEEQTVSLHWLAATTKTREVTDVVAFICDYLGCGVQHHDRGLQGYTSMWEFIGGLRVLDNEKRPEMGVHMIASGEVCELLGFEKLAFIYEALEMQATRVDLAVDHCPFTPRQLYREWLDDNVRTVCKPMKTAVAGRETVRTHRWESSPAGDTLYMGSRSSTQFGRCYDERGWTRFEMEFKQERSEQIMSLLCGDPSQMAEVAKAAITQFVDFIDRDSDVNISRCALQEWWAKFIEGFGEFRTCVLPRPKRTVERVRGWIEGQVSRTLVLYEEIVRKELIREGAYSSMEGALDAARRRLRDLGRSRWDESDELLLSMA